MPFVVSKNFKCTPASVTSSTVQVLSRMLPILFVGAGAFLSYFWYSGNTFGILVDDLYGINPPLLLNNGFRYSVSFSKTCTMMMSRLTAQRVVHLRQNALALLFTMEEINKTDICRIEALKEILQRNPNAKPEIDFMPIMVRVPAFYGKEKTPLSDTTVNLIKKWMPMVKLEPDEGRTVDAKFRVFDNGSNIPTFDFFNYLIVICVSVFAGIVDSFAAVLSFLFYGLEFPKDIGLEGLENQLLFGSLGLIAGIFFAITYFRFRIPGGVVPSAVVFAYIFMNTLRGMEIEKDRWSRLQAFATPLIEVPLIFLAGCSGYYLYLTALFGRPKGSATQEDADFIAIFPSMAFLITVVFNVLKTRYEDGNLFGIKPKRQSSRDDSMAFKIIFGLSCSIAYYSLFGVGIIEFLAFMSLMYRLFHNLFDFKNPASLSFFSILASGLELLSLAKTWNYTIKQSLEPFLERKTTELVRFFKKPPEQGYERLSDDESSMEMEGLSKV